MNARDNILGRIRTALARDPARSDAELARARATVCENRRGPLPTMAWEPVSRFRDRCLHSSSSVEEVIDLAQVPAAVCRYLVANNLPRSGVCWPRFSGLDWAGAELCMEARPATAEDAIGVTGAYCAVAETGTLVLLSGTGCPLLSSLLPETHIAVVPVSRIVRCMEDSWDLLRKEHGTLPRQVAFISGPSRTADIEMTLVIGIHGPYRVHVILVGA